MPNAQFGSPSVPSVGLKLNELDRPSNDDFSPVMEKYHVRLCVQPVLRRLGLSWKNDVHEVYPVVGTSTWAWMKAMPFHHHGIVVTSTSDPKLVCEAVELCLTRWPIFRTVAVEYNRNLRLLVALRAQKSYFDRVISTHPEVESVEALRKLNIQVAPHSSGELFEGLCFYAVIARIRDTGTMGVLFAADHAVYDGRAVTSWMTDLGRIIRREPLVDRAPYKMFADAYYLYQNSELAEEAQSFHRRNFQQNGISYDALWPPGKDLVWVNLSGEKSHSHDVAQQVDQPASKGASIVANVAGDFTRVKSCPTMKEAYTKRGMHASMIVKMALCLFNSLQTGKEHAVFTMLASGRVWPFIPPDIAAHLPDPNNIAGPTMTSQINVTRVAGEETINQLFARVQQEHNLWNQYQHVPQRMLRQLNEESDGLRNQARRQVFDWLAGWDKALHVGGATAGKSEHKVLASSHENLAPPGVVWTGRLNGDDALAVRLSWNRKLFSEEQARGYVDLVHDLVEWICEPGNGERRVEELREAFQQKGGLDSGKVKTVAKL